MINQLGDMSLKRYCSPCSPTWGNVIGITKFSSGLMSKCVTIETFLVYLLNYTLCNTIQLNVIYLLATILKVS